MPGFGEGPFGEGPFGGGPAGLRLRLEVAFDEAVAGVFTLESALDGPDVLSDTNLFSGSYDDVTVDLGAPVTVVMGTDQLAGQTVAGSMTATVARVDDPGYWNPLNSGSPLNLVTPGYKPFRPGRLTYVDDDGARYGIFSGFLRRATWQASTRSCELYFEDVLFRASRVYPVIAATGQTTTGAAIGLVLDAVGIEADQRDLAAGDTIDGFSADGSKNAPQLIADLVAGERGTVFVRSDGVIVFESREMPQTRLAAASFSTSADVGDLETGVDADSLYTRATVTKTDSGGAPIGTWDSVDTVAEHWYGRGDAPALTSPYIPGAASAGQNLADDIVYQGVNGSPPVRLTVAAIDDDERLAILAFPLQSLLTIDDQVGDTDGDFVVQRIEHTMETGSQQTAYTLTRRAARTFTLDSALDGPDVFRY